MKASSYEWTANLLRKLGFTNFRQIDECIKDYNPDDIERFAFGGRQGQLTRFEALLLAGMGDNFLLRHPWKNYDWFINSQLRYLDRLKEEGIAIGNYQPPQN